MFLPRPFCSKIVNPNSNRLGQNRYKNDQLLFKEVVVDLHIQRIVLASEETNTATQQVGQRPIKCQSCSWSQIGANVNGSHHGDSPVLKPTGIRVATKSVPGPTNREHRKLIGVKTMSLGKNYSFYCLECRQYFRI